MEYVFDPGHIHHLKLGNELFVQFHQLGADYGMIGAAKLLIAKYLLVGVHKIIVPQGILSM